MVDIKAYLIINVDYKLSHRLIAYALVISLFLQGCNNSFPPSISNEGIIKNIHVNISRDRFYEPTIPSLEPTNLSSIKQLADMNLTAEGSHLVNFHREAIESQAYVAIHGTKDLTNTNTSQKRDKNNRKEKVADINTVSLVSTNIKISGSRKEQENNSEKAGSVIVVFSSKDRRQFKSREELKDDKRHEIEQTSDNNIEWLCKKTACQRQQVIKRAIRRAANLMGILELPKQPINKERQKKMDKQFLYSSTVSSRIDNLLDNSLKVLNKRLEVSVVEKEALRIKTRRLYAEQSYIARQTELQKKLIEHLAKIKQLLIKEGETLPSCYISYAWPKEENKEEEYWIQTFLCILYDHLTAAGIRVIMDIRDNKPKPWVSIWQFIEQCNIFMEQCYTTDYIILVGTESLFQKYHSNEEYMIKTELKIISNRLEQDPKKIGSSFIYPLLINGTQRTSFAEIFHKHRSVLDAREVGYVLMIRRLVDWMYEKRIYEVGREYEKLWRFFDENCTRLARNASLKEIDEELNIGYHRKIPDSYIKQYHQF